MNNGLIKLPGYDLNSPEHQAMLAEACRTNGMAFDKVFMKERTDETFMIGRHHKVIDETLERVISGEITRLIINIPPGYTKTEKAVINFMSRGFTINPRCRFLHASYSSDLAKLNSSKAKDTVALDFYQWLYSVPISKDSSAKNYWKTVAGGSVYAAASGGSITGFRAGTMEDGFTGALLIDDPLKPTDALSPTEREKVNFRYNNTFASRLAHQAVPVIVIMQRLHPNDLSGHLLTGGSGEKWHHLILPINIKEGYKYPKKYTHGMYIEHGLTPGPLWERKHNKEQIKILSKADASTYYAQYDQDPRATGNNLIRSNYYKAYDNLEKEFDIEETLIIADTAQKIKEHNDFTSLTLFGIGVRKSTGKTEPILIDNIHGKFRANELLDESRKFINKWLPIHKVRPWGVSEIYIEDKASGTGLIQQLEDENIITVIPIQRNSGDRNVRVGSVLRPWSKNPMNVPNPDKKGNEWVDEFMQESYDYRADDSHDHDDRLDNIVDLYEIKYNQQFEY